MSVERMEMMNVIGYMDDLDKVSAEIVKSGCVHIVNALNEINQNNFTVITPEQNTNVLLDLSFIKQCPNRMDNSKLGDMLDELITISGMSRDIRKRYVEGNVEYGEIYSNVERIYQEIMGQYKKREELKEEVLRIQEFQGDMKHIRDINIDIDTLRGLQFFNFKIGKFSRENYEKLKANLENISSIIYEISTIPGHIVVISLTPKVLEAEVDRIFKSLNYEELNISYNLGGTPDTMVKELEAMIEEKKGELKSLDNDILKFNEEYASYIGESYSRLRLYEKIQDINTEVACTNDFFYMAGWIPVSEKKMLQKKLAHFGDRLITIFKSQSEVSSSLVPPTKLRNHWFTRPFETLVGMYGIPSYNEMDPTSFVAISYMIMFGFMFGDIGQGFIFLLAGVLMSIKNRESSFGGILSRLGISSMIFGALFGSVFGNEEVFHPLLIRPMENINTMLFAGIILGIGFTTIGFLYSLINAVKRRNLEDGVFGKDGLVGFVFYWTILLTALNVYKNSQMIVPLPLVITVLCILLMLMVFKQPLANMIAGHRPLYHEAPGDYYIESGFGVIETLLSMLSNTISFIRIGAFALNHVGLFVAFATIAEMINSSAGSIGILILGNIIIIGLEGLIVFIQGLRLEYYELFSKYYDGSGTVYAPVRLNYSKNA